MWHLFRWAIWIISDVYGADVAWANLRCEGSHVVLTDFAFDFILMSELHMCRFQR